MAPATETPSELAGGEKTKFDIAAHHEEIRIEAYHNWVRNGYPQGSEHHDWITAIEGRSRAVTRSSIRKGRASHYIANSDGNSDR